jgi:hypothetical protein
MSTLTSLRVSALADLRNNADLYERLQFLVADLLQLKNDNRWIWDVLYNTGASEYAHIYLPSLYFSLDEQKMLSKFSTDGDTFDTVLLSKINSKFSERLSTNLSTGICSSHDVAPVFMEVFGIQGQFYKASGFAEKHKKFEKKIAKRMKNATKV